MRVRSGYESKDNLLGADWKLWADSAAVQPLLGFNDKNVSTPILNDDGDTTGYETVSFKLYAIY